MFVSTGGFMGAESGFEPENACFEREIALRAFRGQRALSLEIAEALETRLLRFGEDRRIKHMEGQT